MLTELPLGLLFFLVVAFLLVQGALCFSMMLYPNLGTAPSVDCAYKYGPATASTALCKEVFVVPAIVLHISMATPMNYVKVLQVLV